jgi:hypothetical protein
MSNRFAALRAAHSRVVTLPARCERAPDLQVCDLVPIAVVLSAINVAGFGFAIAGRDNACRDSRGGRGGIGALGRASAREPRGSEPQARLDVLKPSGQPAAGANRQERLDFAERRWRRRRNHAGWARALNTSQLRNPASTLDALFSGAARQVATDLCHAVRRQPPSGLNRP